MCYRKWPQHLLTVFQDYAEVPVLHLCNSSVSTYSVIPSATQGYCPAFCMACIYCAVSPEKSPAKMHQVQFLGECEAFFLSQRLLFGERKIPPCIICPSSLFKKWRYIKWLEAKDRMFSGRPGSTGERWEEGKEESIRTATSDLPLYSCVKIGK